MLEEISRIVREAGEIILSAAQDKDVHEKSGPDDLVTRYDAQVQRFLEDRLLSLLPGADFLGEEDLGEELHAGWEYRFIVDPIDGTTNFVKGFPHSGISVGLARRGELILGVVYDPYLDELFTAQRGGGAHLNGRPLHVSGADLAHGVAVFGTSPYYRQYTRETFALGEALFRRCMDVRRMAAASLDLCYVAAGRVECYFEYLLSPWDHAAGSLIVQEAGGVATDLSGAPLALDRKCSLAAGNPKCHTALLELAKSVLVRSSS